jgi:hypothetical protein
MSAFPLLSPRSERPSVTQPGVECPPALAAPNGDRPGQALQLEEKRNFVIPRRAARRGISRFRRLNLREIPHFVRKDKIFFFFRNLLRLSGFAAVPDYAAETG